MENLQKSEASIVVSTWTLIVAILLFIGISTLLFILISSRGQIQSPGTNAEGILSEEGGKQVITILARGAYSPRSVTAKSGVPTILRMKTNNSYGCERSFAIPKLGIQESLPATGVTDIDLGTPKSGSKLFGTCSMGMYTVTILFN